MLVATRHVKKPRRVKALHVRPRAPTSYAYSAFLLASVLSCTNSLKGVREDHVLRKNQLLELLPFLEKFALGHIVCIGGDGPDTGSRTRKSGIPPVEARSPPPDDTRIEKCQLPLWCSEEPHNLVARALGSQTHS